MRLRERWSYDRQDPAIKLFSSALQAWDFDIPEGSRVLELGCAESDWASWLLLTVPGIEVVGVDVRACPDYPGRFVQGDAADWQTYVRAGLTLTRDSFDWVVSLGAIEHFGLGYPDYGDPVNPIADVCALEHAGELLKPGGHVYLDVPWTPSDPHWTTHYRCYDDRGVDGRLLKGLTSVRRAWAKNEQEHEITPDRPETIWHPFWFIAAWGKKPA